MAKESKDREVITVNVPKELANYFRSYYNTTTATTAIIKALEHSRKLDLNALEAAVNSRSDCFVLPPMVQAQLKLLAGKPHWQVVVYELVCDYLDQLIAENKLKLTKGQNDKK